MLLLLLGFNTGCEKEYSYEGGPLPDSILVDSGNVNDTVTNDLLFPVCEGCQTLNTTSSLYWSFKVGKSVLCGTITNTVVSIEGTAMTFFGPSFCSSDNGLIINAFFNNEELNKDQSNLTAQQATLEYYDNTNQVDVLQSKRPNVFTMTIDEYASQTGIATGKFSGTVVDKNGSLVTVQEGKFRIKF